MKKKESNYVIKQGSLYLHVGDDLKFKDTKIGAEIFNAENANIVVKSLKNKDFKGIFKAKIKDKYIVLKPKPKIGVIERWRERRAKNRLIESLK